MLRKLPFGGNFASAAKIGSRTIGIDGLQKQDELPDTSSIVYQLLHTNLRTKDHVVFLDNFFTKKELLIFLKTRGWAACGTAKCGSGIDPDLVLFKDVSKKYKDWGLKAITTVDDEVLCMGWVDNNTVLFMTTAHTIQEACFDIEVDARRRSGIPKEVVKDGEEPKIKFPLPTSQYNASMGGVDGNAQQRAYYTAETHRDVRYSWPLLLFILDAGVLNAFILWKLDHPESKITHSEFQRIIALHLTRNPAGQTRQQAPPPTYDNPSIPRPEHRWRKLPGGTRKKKTCTACRITTGGRPPKNPLQPISGNIRKTKRPSQTSWGCTASSCAGVAICKKEECWN